MRPPKQQQSAIRAPLNQLLGTEANVRVLRVVSRDLHPLSRSELGRRAGLETKGAHLAANRLLQAGMLKRIGSGRRQQVQLEQKHPLSSSIRSLFQAERDRVARVIDGLTRIAKELSSSLDAAWIEGPFATEQDRLGDAITVSVLAGSDKVQDVLSSFRETITLLESAEDVTVELKGLTRADLAIARPQDLKKLGEVLPLFGPPPIAFTSLAKEYKAIRNILVHSGRDDQQLLLAREIAQRLISDPAKLEDAKEYIVRRLESASKQERPALKEWYNILHTMSAVRLRNFMLDTSERATRLRQTMPFLNVLSPKERADILAKSKSQ